MITAQEIESRVEEGSSTLVHAGISLHRALMDIEVATPDEAVSDLQQCLNRTDEAIEQYQELIPLAEGGLSEERGYPNDESATRLLFDNFRAKAEVEGLFGGCEDFWELLRLAAERNDPLAGYELFASMMVKFRDEVNGLLQEIERDTAFIRVKLSTWRTMELYQRTLTLGRMIAFINAEMATRLEENRDAEE